jgi:nondiscriminating glutamyl-tRNA synthetase
VTVRTRFAPSPTGALHLGNVRIAVFNWLFARHHGGVFILRMEDTDTDRNLPGAEEGVMADLRWLGLDWDEGPDVGGGAGPYRQSERAPLYRAAAERLLEAGLAYLSHDAPEEEEGDGGGERRPFRARPAEEEARRATSGMTPAIRFRVPLREIHFQDEVKGQITMSGNDIGDFIILRSDGRPTYNFAVVVDDVGMEISHVIRGVGHLSNTPRQVLLFDALGADRPRFVHLPTVLGPDRKKLSKREGAEAVAELRRRGVPPGAVVNYLSLLGWSSPDGREVMSVDELVRDVSLERLGSADTVYDPEKLRWMAHQHLAALDDEALARAVEPWLDRDRFPLEGARLVAAVSGVRSHMSALGEIDEALEPLYPGAAVLATGVSELREDAEAMRAVDAVREALAAIPWDESGLGPAIREAGRRAGLKGPALFHPVRRALTGATSGPELAKVLVALGRDEVLRRLDLVGDTGEGE